MNNNRIQQLRERDGISVSNLVIMLNISRNTLYNYETGKTAIPSDILIKLSGIFNVSVDYILCLSGDKETQFYCVEIEEIKEKLIDLVACLSKLYKKGC